MSLVNSESRGSALQKLRGALIDEIGATRLYDELIEAIPQFEKELTEIKNDEINHQGRLVNMIMKLDTAQLEAFNKGLEQKG